MKWIGAAYMVWLAVKLARATPIKAGEAEGRPMTFLQAAAFQWINPKAWIMALTAVATYSDPADYTRTVLMVALVFGIVTLPCVAMLGIVRHGAAPRPAATRECCGPSTGAWGSC